MRRYHSLSQGAFLRYDPRFLRPPNAPQTHRTVLRVENLIRPRMLAESEHSSQTHRTAKNTKNFIGPFFKTLGSFYRAFFQNTAPPTSSLPRHPERPHDTISANINQGRRVGLRMNKGKRFLFIKSVENEHFPSAIVIGGSTLCMARPSTKLPAQKNVVSVSNK